MLSVKNFINYTDEGGGGSDLVKAVLWENIAYEYPMILNTDTITSINPFNKAVNGFTALTVSTTYN